ncbi:uncharacterized protein SAPINGB_P000566 [Magnusiomyces paraingens]|uniref:coproporphyrinogen oxidase n=1 Tax=Magnusiomyces paraingens TaxID=2606893 RepID=A0A5E8B067_9ASCO|nr:uncharacterized protein SAPINGB_P000566 [Saprochaete ingens]VVT44884.1 unnamed protein product [Saprochaete ingens]
MTSIRDQMEQLIYRKQQEIVDALEAIEVTESSTKFLMDKWQRDEASEGGGLSAVIQGGSVIEKGGALVSVVSSKLPPAAVQRMRADHKALDILAEQTGGEMVPLPFNVCGLSLIMHPKNPFAPTVHLNYRYFEIRDPETNAVKTWWFGGGADMTPHYLYPEDAELFHSELKKACDGIDPEFYPRFKKWCDEYFFIKHRKEGRGIGGIFFDDIGEESGKTPEQLLKFVEACFNAFLNAYPVILKRRYQTEFNDNQKRWQLLRRGRYVEFNLIYDRGTHFGLLTPNARIESILVSLPLHVSWEYMHEPEKGSHEAETLAVLKTPRAWV